MCWPPPPQQQQSKCKCLCRYEHGYLHDNFVVNGHSTKIEVQHTISFQSGQTTIGAHTGVLQPGTELNVSESVLYSYLSALIRVHVKHKR